MSFFVDMPDFAPYEDCVGEWVEAKDFLRDGKSFGYFGCSYCQKKWMSAHARKGFKQGCKDCDRFFYPIYLWKNDFSYNKKEKALEDNEKPHISYLCEACKKGVCMMGSVRPNRSGYGNRYGNPNRYRYTNRNRYLF